MQGKLNPCYRCGADVYLLPQEGTKDAWMVSCAAWRNKCGELAKDIAGPVQAAADEWNWLLSRPNEAPPEILCSQCGEPMAEPYPGARAMGCRRCSRLVTCG